MNEAPATLAELLAPMTVPEFLERQRRRELFYRPGSNGGRYAPMLGWAGLRSIIEAGKQSYKRDGIRVTRESQVAPPDRWMTDGKVDVAKLDSFVANGFSVVALHVEAHMPELAGVCEDIRKLTREGSFVGVVVTSGIGAGAFKIHYDPEDLIILQLEGTKRWQVFGPVVENPLRGMAKQTLDDPKPLLDEVLEPGDMLFVPGGNWHHCEAGLSTSVHLGIFFLPPAAWHVVNEIVRPLIEDEAFRIPLTRLNGEATLNDVESDLKQRLIDKIGSLDLEEFISRWHKAAY